MSRLSQLSESEVGPWLEGFRAQSDALADEAATELMRAGGLSRGADLVAVLEARAATADGPCARLWAHSHSTPAWVSFERMQPAIRLGLRNPVQSAMSLLLGSLVESYGSARAAKVLIRAGRLASDTQQRLRDTAEFVLRLATSRGAPPGSAGHRHVLKVRLVHAFVRHGTLRRGDWRSEWGHPVNQEDYSSTLLAFGHVSLRGLVRLGVRPTLEEEESVQHLYRWVGHVMGVHPDLLTDSRDEERRLYGHIVRRQLHPDEDSRELAQALVRAVAGREPFYLPAPALYALSRRLVGDELADAYAFPRSAAFRPLGSVVLPTLSGAQRLVERVPGLRPRLETWGEKLSSALFARGLGAATASPTGPAR